MNPSLQNSTKSRLQKCFCLSSAVPHQQLQAGLFAMLPAFREDAPVFMSVVGDFRADDSRFWKADIYLDARGSPCLGLFRLKEAIWRDPRKQLTTKLDIAI